MLTRAGALHGGQLGIGIVAACAVAVAAVAPAPASPELHATTGEAAKRVKTPWAGTYEFSFGTQQGTHAGRLKLAHGQGPEVNGAPSGSSRAGPGQS